MFLEVVIRKEERWKDTGEELEIDLGAWQDTEENDATTAGKKCAQHAANPQRHDGDTKKNLRQTARTTKRRHFGEEADLSKGNNLNHF